MANPGEVLSSDYKELKRQARLTEQEWENAYNSGLEDASDYFQDDESPGNGEQEGRTETPGAATSGVRLSFRNDAQKIIVVALTITVIVALIENAHVQEDKGTKQGVPPSTIIVGGFVSGAILLGMSYFLPEFASGFAVIAMLSTLLERGKPFWDIITSLTGKPLAQTGPKTPSGGATPSVPAGSGKLIGTSTPNPPITV